MKFDVYQQFTLEVLRENEQWVAYRKGAGLRRREHELIIPAELAATELINYLDDIYHEFASPGAVITQID